jgi:hypothetical protein
VLRNTGNVNVRYVSEREVGAPADTAAYRIERPLMEGGLDVRTNEFDTLLVRFEPTAGGLHMEQYVVETDLLSRPFKRIPDGAEQRTFVFRGFALKPQMEVSPTNVDFGRVVLQPGCASAVDRQVLVRNGGNIPLRIDSARIEPSGTPIGITPAEPSAPIEVGKSQTLVLRYQPTAIEQLNAQLVLYTNAFGPPTRLPLTGSSIAADSITVSIGAHTRRPGTTLEMPIIADGGRVSVAQTTSITVSFDPSLLSYRGSITGGTATEGASIVVERESPPGVLTLELQANGSFKARDTFIVISLDTYLGRNAATELSLNDATTMFGNAGCASILDVTTRSGTFQLDSVCGLGSKTATGGVLGLQSAPLPVGEVMYVDFVSSESPTILRLFDAYGNLVYEVAAAVPTAINTANFPVGMYLLVAQRGPYIEQVSCIKQ